MKKKVQALREVFRILLLGFSWFALYGIIPVTRNNLK